MMRTYRINIKRCEYFQVTVKSENSSEARTAAIAALDNAGAPLSVNHEVMAYIQLGEPWAYSEGWYDLHGPADVVVVERAPGNAFTEADVKLLSERLKAIGFPVVESWNGAGCGTVSFRCKDRKKPVQFSANQITKLLAPRELKEKS